MKHEPGFLTVALRRARESERWRLMDRLVVLEAAVRGDGELKAADRLVAFVAELRKEVEPEPTPIVIEPPKERPILADSPLPQGERDDFTMAGDLIADLRRRRR